MYIDAFNGDADGICALIQLRQVFPVDAGLVTGVKRDIELLSRVSAQPGDRLAVLDISLDKNRSALLDLLDNQVEVFYADHHFCGEIPLHPGLTSIIDTDANLCTSLLINDYLRQQCSGWAVVGAFGDNLVNSARKAAQTFSLSESQLQQLQELGICINYNAYGETLDDLYISPEVLYKQLAVYPTPMDFLAERNDVFRQLLSAYADDIGAAENIAAEYENARIAVFILPDEKWARRVNGVWGNELANRNPDRAHAVLSHNRRGGYRISVRAPLNNNSGADVLCGSFPEGGGRKAAAGINHLEKQQLGAFIEAFRLHYA